MESFTLNFKRVGLLLGLATRAQSKPLHKSHVYITNIANLIAIWKDQNSTITIVKSNYMIFLSKLCNFNVKNIIHFPHIHISKLLYDLVLLIYVLILNVLASVYFLFITYKYFSSTTINIDLKSCLWHDSWHYKSCIYVIKLISPSIDLIQLSV